MQKISVLFKPTYRSKISGDLQGAGYYEIDLQKFSISDFKKHKKIKIAKVPYSEIGELYEFCQKYGEYDNVIVIMCNISELFE